jgi:hypothetical protein
MHPVQPQVQPVMVRVVGEPAQELGLGQIIGQALGLTGIILVLSLLMGLVVGGIFIWVRMRSARARRDGEAGDQIRLRLEPPVRPAPAPQPPAVHSL